MGVSVVASALISQPHIEQEFAEWKLIIVYLLQTFSAILDQIVWLGRLLLIATAVERITDIRMVAAPGLGVVKPCSAQPGAFAGNCRRQLACRASRASACEALCGCVGCEFLQPKQIDVVERRALRQNHIHVILLRGSALSLQPRRCDVTRRLGQTFRVGILAGVAGLCVSARNQGDRHAAARN